MLSELAVSDYVLPLPALGSAPKLGFQGRDKDVVAAEELATFRSALKAQRDSFDKLYNEAERLEIAPDALEAHSNTVYCFEKEAAASLVPQMELCRRLLSDVRNRSGKNLSKSSRQAAEELLDIGSSFLELYQNLRIRLFKLASDRRSLTEPGSPVFDDAESAAEYLRKLIAE